MITPEYKDYLLKQSDFSLGLITDDIILIDKEQDSELLKKIFRTVKRKSIKRKSVKRKRSI